MSSIFRKDDTYVDKPRRNTFDLSFENNLTLNMGKIVPVFCKEVLPGDSFQIDTSFALKYLPQVFPVQTRQRASVKFYYVRNRPLWNDWMDFIGKTKSGLTPPYLNFSLDNARLLRPSSIADYMGVPVRIRGSFLTPSKSVFKLGIPNAVVGSSYLYQPNGGLVYSNVEGDPYTVNVYKNVGQMFVTLGPANYVMEDVYGGTIGAPVKLPNYAANPSGYAALGSNPNYNTTGIFLMLYRKPMFYDGTQEMVVTANSACYMIVRDDQGVDYLYHMSNGTNPLDSVITVKTIENGELVEKSVYWTSIVGFLALSNSPSFLRNIDVSISVFQNYELCWCDVQLSEWPFVNPYNQDGVRINALPFRALQAVYNSHIRHAENNPFILNGVPEYNKYISSDGGGATSPSDLLADYQANWVDDRFTTALPTPQQGNAPLVGLTGIQGATLTTSTEDGTTSTLHLQVDADTGNVVLVDGVSRDSPEYLNDAMMSAVEYGITINDLRNVNSFQRWLENNIRRGYKYKDQLMSHYGVSARFDVLDMPEFIGGVARDVECQQITQTTQNEYGNLGEYAGQSYVGGNGHAIEHYCDEHGYIIGIMSITPMPVYQDVIPKHLLKADAFDYYFPEFGHIGPQPITNKELAFSQSFLEGNMDKTFGYQRAWYDYIESLDEVHGLFQSDFRNFLIARDFGKVPTLGRQFLTVDNDDINNTFYSNDDKDKILGQLRFRVSAKRTIPLIGIPSIE